MFKDVAADKLEYPTLARVVEHIEPQLWAEDPTRALLVVMRRAVKALPEEPAWKCAAPCTWRHVGRLLYFGSEVDPSFHEYDDYLTGFEADSGWPKNRLPWPKRTRGYLTKMLRDRLTVILLAMEREAASSQSSLSQKQESGDGAYNPLYIHREELSRQFGEAVNAHGSMQLVAIIGQPGTGKSWLARELTRAAEPDGRDAPVIRIIAGGIFTRDLEAALATYNVTDAAAHRKVKSRDRLARLLNDEHSPRMVVLDNLDSTQQLHELLPSHTRSIVIATCRDKADAPELCRCIEVGAMNPAEAISMARKRLPHLTDDEARLLAVSTLHGYPLLIKHACTILNNRNFSVEEFCRDIAAGPSIARRVGIRGEGTLYTVLAKMLEVVKQRSELAHRLLTFVAFANPIPIVSQEFLRRCTTICCRPAPTITACAEAIQVLHELSFIDLSKPSKLRPSETYISVHPLTQYTLMELYSDAIADVRDCFTSVFESYREEYKANYDDMSSEIKFGYMLAAIQAFALHHPDHQDDVSKLQEIVRELDETIDFLSDNIPKLIWIILRNRALV